MSFEEIVGNDKIKQELGENVENGTVSHSYLFVGQEGIGKKLFANEFAKMILCLGNKKACDRCDSCIKFNSDNNPDFVMIEPDGNSIKISQIREMQDNVFKKPIVSNKKVFIIDNSDKMTEEAQNSLLKTLEEPPEYVIIILISSNENKLLNTIKSRCLKISFNSIPTKDIVDYIAKKEIMTNPSDSLLAMCNGSIGKLIKINQNLEEYSEIEKNTHALINGEISNVVKMINNFDILYKSKDIVLNLLDYMIVIIYEHINKDKDYRRKFLNLISIIEKSKLKLMSNANYDMCIDDLLLKIWEEINEDYSRS